MGDGCWERSQTVRSFVKNVALLTFAAGFGSICSVIALALNARSLGPAAFGTLAAIQAYTGFVATLLTFESWQPIVRLGVRFPARLRLTISCGLALDLLAAVTAAVIAVSGVVLISSWRLFGGGQELAAIYSVSLLAGVAGTPKGYLRLSGRFSAIARTQVAQGAALVITSVGLWLFAAPLWMYVVAFSLLGASYNIAILVQFFRCLQVDGICIINPFSAPSRRRYLGRVVSMAVGTSLLSTLANTRRHISLLLVSGLLGEVSAGHYAVGARIAAAASRLSGPLNQVIFPEVVRASAGAPDEWKRAMMRATIVGGALSGLLATAGIVMSGTLVGYAAGHAYTEASDIFSLLFSAECIGLAGLHLSAAIQARQGTKPLIIIALLAVAVHACLSVAMIGALEAEGVAVATLAAAIATYAGILGMARATLARSGCANSAYRPE